MTFVAKCPQCGAVLGNGWHQPDPNHPGREITALNIQVQSDPPVKPEQIQPVPEKKEYAE